MATIYAYPNSTGSGNCAILASQENYYAPFLTNIGTWTQLRVSLYLSFCGSGGFQSPMSAETVTVNSPNLAFYWGIGSFLTSIGSLLTPLSVGSNFIGISTYGSASTSLSTVQANGGGCVISVSSQNANPNFLVSSNGATSIKSQFGLYDFPCMPPTGNTGTVNYSVPNTLSFTIVNKGLTGQQITVTPNYDTTGSNPNYYSYNDTATLRTASMNLLSNAASVTVYYTSGCVATGGPLPIPDTMYLHSPLNNNLLRIHNVLIEKYY